MIAGLRSSLCAPGDKMVNDNENGFGRFARNIAIAILIGWVIFPFISGGCRLSLLQTQDEATRLKAFCQGSPQYTSNHVALYRYPPDYHVERILDEADRTVTAIYQWLGIDESPSRVRVLIFSPDEPEGQYWLKRKRHRHNSAGSMFPGENILLVVGDPKNPRFWTVLRHEFAHYALHNMLELNTPIPFWLNEGIASLFETGLDPKGRPLPNRERLQLLQYLSKTRPSLYLKPLIKTFHLGITNGAAYARAWGIVAFLYQNNRCPTAYLKELNHTQEKPLVLFNNHILKTGETLDDFENAMRQWLNHQGQ